jgi:hypothetical protein
VTSSSAAAAAAAAAGRYLVSHTQLASLFFVQRVDLFAMSVKLICL